MDINLVIYILAAVLGTLAYNYEGYLKYGKTNGEKFDWSKWLATLLQGGGVASVLTYVNSLSVGSALNYYILIEAILFGIGFSAGIDKLQDTISPSASPTTNIVNGIVEYETLKNKLATDFGLKTPPAATLTAQPTPSGPPASPAN
jgi:hypothetical protein